MRQGSFSHLIHASADFLQEIFRYLRYVGDFWTELFRHDKEAMRKADHASVKEVEFKAPGASASDATIILRKLDSGEIFGAFELDYRRRLWIRI